MLLPKKKNGSVDTKMSGFVHVDTRTVQWTSATITFQIVVGKRPANVTYVMYSMKQGSTRHEHSTLHTSIQYVHNLVALTRANRHEHVAQLRVSEW